jgi:membrane protease YdiL (CAAX protease family)
MPKGDKVTDHAFIVKVLNRVKRNVAVELAVLAALTFAFLLVFPERPFLADAGLALFALGLLAVNARYTKNVVWGQFPPALDRRSRVRKTCMFVGPATSIVVMGLFATGLTLGYIEGGWETAVRRVGNWHVLVALALYFPWALLQQTLFQFYLLGRFRTVFPTPVAVTCTGIAYALVHPPDIAVTTATAIAGVCWTYIYFHYRVLLPIAFSHALLGSTFYYWVYGRDLVKEWVAGL